MFYVKAKINEEVSINIDITDENVFTKCPGCEKEQQVDLQEILKDGDLFGTTVICADCTKKENIGIKCGKCGNINKEIDYFCRQCSNPIQDKGVCPNCGDERCGSKHNYCGTCGAPLK